MGLVIFAVFGIAFMVAGFVLGRETRRKEINDLKKIIRHKKKHDHQNKWFEILRSKYNE